jgi:hypothetical protein
MTNYTQNGGFSLFKLSDQEKEKLRAARQKMSSGLSKFGKNVSGSIANSKQKFALWNQDRKDNQAARAILATRQRDDLAGFKDLVKSQRGFLAPGVQGPAPQFGGKRRKSKSKSRKPRRKSRKSMSKRRKSKSKSRSRSKRH